MSHFATLVISKPNKSIDELLDPYDESIRVAPYLGITKEKLFERIAENREQTKRRLEQEKLEDPVAYEKKYSRKENVPEILTMTDEEVYQMEIENELVDKRGNILSTYNPNSKWDWYVIGGRWENFLITKTGDRVNQCKFKDLDVEAMNTLPEAANHHNKRFWEVVVEGQPMEEGESEEIFRTIYNREYFLKKYKTKENYVRRRQQFSTFAVITSDGTWHEQGEMGYFGMSSETFEEEEDWDDRFTKEFLTDLDPDNTITLVDCHI